MPCRNDGAAESHDHRLRIEKLTRIWLRVSKVFDAYSAELVTRVDPSTKLTDPQTYEHVLTAHICHVMRWAKLNFPNVFEDMLYGDARDKGAREMADWWEAHEEADRAREDEKRRLSELEKKAFSILLRLPADERRVLAEMGKRLPEMVDVFSELPIVSSSPDRREEG